MIQSITITLTEHIGFTWLNAMLKSEKRMKFIIRKAESSGRGNVAMHTKSQLTQLQRRIKELKDRKNG